VLRIELITQLRRARSLMLFGALAGIVVLAGVTEAAKAGGRGGAATFSALNFTESGLNFMDPVLFGLVVALLGSILGGSDRDWGTLRYLYVRPVSRARLVAGKWGALVVCCALTVAVFLGVALLTGLVIFGWHPFHRSGSSLSATAAAVGVVEAGGYVLVCLLSIGSIALALGLLLPRPVEALGITLAFLVGSAILDNVSSVHAIIAALPVHYWLRWTSLFDGGGGGLVLGLAVQAATVAVVMTAAYALLARRDPAA
jgi:ABC-2 type transport system permease protein